MRGVIYILKDIIQNKKTLIGAILFFILYGLLGIGLIDQATFDQVAKWAELLVGIGLVHKGYKSMT